MEKIRQNIFSIGEVYELQRENQWVEKNRETFREFGYFGTPSAANTGTNNNSSINRIDYSNDTNSPIIRSSVSVPRGELNVVGNTNYGYFCGGRIFNTNPTPPPNFLAVFYSTVDRINYANDTSSLNTNPSPNFSINLRSSSFGNSNFGYFGGGYSITTPSKVSSIERINYANDSFSYVGNFVDSFGVGNGVSNSNYGYTLGGFPSVHYTKVDRLDYSNDLSTPSTRGNLISNSRVGSATGNANFGYLAQGIFPVVSNIHRISYANDLVDSSIRTFQSSPRWFGYATGNSNFGYFIGNGVIVDRLDYANDTSSVNIRGSLSTFSSSASDSATSSASFGGSPVSYLGAPWVATAPFGYFSGAALGALDRVDYTNDTAATTLRSQLSDTRTNLTATGNSSYGYYGGGIPGPVVPGAPTTSTIDRIDYTNDTSAASIRGPLTIARSFLAATGNSNFGYFGGGGRITGPYRKTVDRIDYKNDTVQASPRGEFIVEFYNSQAATGNSNFGYFGGGTVPQTSSIRRIDYANDLSNPQVRTSLSEIKFSLTATGNSNFGYFGGGSNAPGRRSTVDRIDYSNDTQVTSTRGPLSLERDHLSATGNSNFGYFGGARPTGPAVSTVDRIDYSNDTQTASTRGPLSSARGYMAASSSQAFGGAPNTPTDPLPTYIRANTVFDDSNTLELPFKRALGSFGYWIGGLNPPVSTITRLDFSNDNATALVRGNLGAGAIYSSTSSNSNFGYIHTNVPFSSSIRRIDYNNDTANAVFRNTITSTRADNTGSVGNNNFGYFGGGYFGPFLSKVDRIDYSNDLSSLSTRGPLSISKRYLRGIGNLNFGYFAGGGFPYVSVVNRIDYSNDTAKTSVRGLLNFEGVFEGASGNNNFGYFGGSYTGGGVPGKKSTIYRIDYLNDTARESIRGPLSSEFINGGTGNLNFGYFGNISSGGCDKIDYSNDLVTATRKSSGLARAYSSATTNARNS